MKRDSGTRESKYMKFGAVLIIVIFIVFFVLAFSEDADIATEETATSITHSIP